MLSQLINIACLKIIVCFNARNTGLVNKNAGGRAATSHGTFKEQGSILGEKKQYC